MNYRTINGIEAIEGLAAGNFSVLAGEAATGVDVDGLMAQRKLTEMGIPNPLVTYAAQNALKLSVNDTTDDPTYAEVIPIIRNT